MLSFGSSASAPTKFGSSAPTKNFFKHLVGLHIKSASSTIDGLKATGSPVRVLHPGAKATRDFNDSRVNVSVDKNGNISSVHMG